MAEELRTTKYIDNTSIQLVTNESALAGLITPAYCRYDNLQGAGCVLYNWYTVSTTTNGGKNVCPTGWHVPIEDEWKQSEMHLGISQAQADATGWRGTNEGGKLKETGMLKWRSPNAGATKERGFTAYAFGYRDSNKGYFIKNGGSCVW